MKLKVAVLFGGKSVEHEISIITAMQCIEALNREKYEIFPIYISKNNQFFAGDSIGLLREYQNLPKLIKKSIQVIPMNLDGKGVFLSYPRKCFKKNVLISPDCVLPIVHGTNVEDGTLQGLLKLLNLPYSGSDVTASALGMDKFAQKCIFRKADLPVLDSFTYFSWEYDTRALEICIEIQKNLSFPVVVKPINLGSSIGITKANDMKSLEHSLEIAFRFSERVIIEHAVEHLREINCSVLGNAENFRASVCEEPLGISDILSYDQKYLSNKKGKMSKKIPEKPDRGMARLDRQVPAKLPEEVYQKIQEYSIKAFRALHCEGVARIDFLMNDETGALFLNEINTIPGSLSYYLWEFSGLSFENLLDELIKLAFERHRKEAELTYQFDTNVLSSTDLGKKIREK